jgi:hypothetical protein
MGGSWWVLEIFTMGSSSFMWWRIGHVGVRFFPASGRLLLSITVGKSEVILKKWYKEETMVQRGVVVGPANGYTNFKFW